MSVSRTDSIISPTKENSLSTAANGHIFTLIEGQTSIFVSVWMGRRPRKKFYTGSTATAAAGSAGCLQNAGDFCGQDEIIILLLHKLYW